jgi:hypothetical protein
MAVLAGAVLRFKQLMPVDLPEPAREHCLVLVFCRSATPPGTSRWVCKKLRDVMLSAATRKV